MPELFTPSPGPDGRPHETQPKWRRDFPLDTPQDNYVARRDFVKFLTLISGAFVVGQLWIGMDSLRRRARAKGGFVRMKITTLKALPVGETMLFYYPTKDDPCLLVRPSDEEIFAYSQVCTHLSCAIQPRVKQREFHCPCHNGWFDMNNGRVISGPPERPLPKITLDIKHGKIYATGVEVSA